MSESSAGILDEFRQLRERMNATILGSGNLTINRFFALDSRAYDPGALGTRTKERLGLVVGGSIVIPHVRRAVARREELQ